MRCTNLNPMTKRMGTKLQMRQKNRSLHAYIDLTKTHTSVSLTQLQMIFLIANPICNHRPTAHR